MSSTKIKPPPVRRRLAALPLAVLIAGIAVLAVHLANEPKVTPPVKPVPTISSRTTPAVTPKPALATNCIARPSACGYPDPSNTGVPAGTTLTPSGSINITKAGTVISGLDVRGTIVVSANNVTIRDTRVATAYPDGGAILIEPKISGTLIEDSTIHGQGSGADAVAYAIQNAGWGPNTSTVVRRVQMYDCTECYNGPGTLEDSYANVSAVTAGAHYEDVYYGGAAGLLTIRHDTLLNPQPQTAVVFTKPDFGTVTNVTVTDSLLAGGGWTIYGGGDTATNLKITNNRFSPIYHPKIGYFGIDTGFNWPKTVWTGNRWDTTLKPIASG
jgi:hypothetical protein